jgi:hypothetical protein
MADVPVSIHEQSLSRISAAGSLAGEHAVSYSKILDLNYVLERNMVSLVQSLGAREVTSRSGQEGVPLAGSIAGK